MVERCIGSYGMDIADGGTRSRRSSGRLEGSVVDLSAPWHIRVLAGWRRAGSLPTNATRYRARTWAHINHGAQNASCPLR